MHIPGLFHGNNVTEDVLNSGEGIDNTAEYSSRFIEDGSFIRLSNLTFEYRFRTTSLKWLSSLRIFATGTNLFLITNYKGYDPEASTNAAYQGIPSLGLDFTSYPMSRSIQFGINVGF